MFQTPWYIWNKIVKSWSHLSTLECLSFWFLTSLDSIFCGAHEWPNFWSKTNSEAINVYEKTWVCKASKWSHLCQYATSQMTPTFFWLQRNLHLRSPQPLRSPTSFWEHPCPRVAHWWFMHVRSLSWWFQHVSTHLKNISQIGSFPQGSGWKFQKISGCFSVPCFQPVFSSQADELGDVDSETFFWELGERSECLCLLYLLVSCCNMYTNICLKMNGVL